jgi:hypothetical protein
MKKWIITLCLFLLLAQISWADEKISDFGALSEAPASGDLLPIVDVSDTTQGATGSTKKITVTNFLSGLSVVYHPLWDYDYTDLINKPTIIDWTSDQGATDINAANIPTLNQNTTGTAAGLTAQYIDWNSASGGDSIANKPTIPTVNDSITDSNTTSAPSENAVFDALALKAPLTNPVFTGGISVAGTTAGGQYMFLREDIDNTADNYTGWGVYGELAHDTIYAYPLAAPVTGQVMSWATPGNQTMSDGSTQSVSVGTFVYKDEAQTPLAGAAADFDDNCTGACLRGGTFRVTTVGSLLLPNSFDGLLVTVTDAGATPTIEPLATGTDDTIIYNETSCGQGNPLVGDGTTGGMVLLQYGGADTILAYGNGFACGS